MIFISVADKIDEAVSKQLQQKTINQETNQQCSKNTQNTFFRRQSVFRSVKLQLTRVFALLVSLLNTAETLQEI